MANIADVKADITSFNEYQLRELFNYIGEMLTIDTLIGNLNKEFKESRFSKGKSALSFTKLPLEK